MRIRIRQRRELAVALPPWSAVWVASAAAGALAVTVWRARRRRVGDEAERWLQRRG